MNAKQIWADGLAGYGGDEIKRGLTRLNPDFIPSLEAFRRFCRPPRSVQTERIHRANELRKTALEAPTVDREEAIKRVGKLAAALKSKPKPRRQIYHAGYGRQEHQIELDKAKAAGEPLYLVEMRAMAWHGWTEADEAAYRRAAKDCGWTLKKLYQPGHEPPDSILSGDYKLK